MKNIQINGNCYVGVEFEGLDENDFNLKTFSKLLIVEVSGLVLPLFELHLFQYDYRLFKSLTVLNKEIKINYGTSSIDARSYVCRLYNYNYTPADQGGYNLILTGIVDLKDFTNKPKMRCITGNSDEVIKSFDTVKPDVNYVGSDSQNWIQHNISDKSFAENVIQNAYVADNDFIIGALTIDNQLIVKSVKKIYESKSEPYKITQDNLNGDDKLRFDGLKVESDSAIWSNFLSEGRKLPVLSLQDRKIEILPDRQKYDLNQPVLSLWDRIGNTVTGKSNVSYNAYEGNINYPTLIDCGNCHKNYYFAWLNNLNNIVKFNRNNIYIFSSRAFLNNDKLKLLDLVNFIPNDNTKSDSSSDPMAGKYILTEKVTQITPQGFGHRLRLNRDYTLT